MLVKPALIFIGATVLTVLCASASSFAREKSVPSLLQLFGAGFLIVVVSTHVAETAHLAPALGWGRANSPGHYLDLVSAVAGIVLAPVGYFSRKLRRTARSQ